MKRVIAFVLAIMTVYAGVVINAAASTATPAATPAAALTATPIATATPVPTPVIKEMPLKLRFTRKKVKIRKGRSTSLKVKHNGVAKVRFSVSSKKVLKLFNKKANSVSVKGRKKGRAYVIASVDSTKVKCKVIVRKK